MLKIKKNYLEKASKPCNTDQKKEEEEKPDADLLQKYIKEA